MQILGLGKVRIMRFSGRKRDLGGVLSGSDPDARDKEKPQRARLVRATMREKCTDGKGGRRGTEAPPDPPILADAKGGRRTEGRERADDTIVLKKKKEATQGTKGKEKRADDTIVLKKKKGKKESIVKESIVKKG